ncbi:MAG TPA: TIGR02266 family protein [Kofleriaceae bacterium]|nr:TIGR02266 family protein [Kofleriaceae bacterium]
MATTNTRTASRTPVTLKIKFKSSTLEQFIERYSVDISHGGIFIRTKDPLPVGTNLKFEFQLKDSSPLITGDGTVVWTRDFDPTRSGVAPGMGVRFDRLPSESQEVLEQILAHKTAKMGKLGGEAGFLDVPTKVAFGNVPTKVTPRDVLEGLAQSESRRTLLGVTPSKIAGKGDDITPLPNPQPFHTDLDEFPDEAFEEATKVAALEALARRTAVSEDSVSVPFGKSLEEDVTVERRGRISTRPPLRAGSVDAAGGGLASAAVATAPAPIFHDLPVRSPFASEAAAAAELARAPSPPLPHGVDHADPFSLPPGSRGGEDAAAEAARHRLHIVPPLAPDPSGEDGEQHEPAEGPVEAPAEPARRGSPLPSNMQWIAAAAVLLLIGGVTGFWLLSGRGGEQRAPGEAAGQQSDPSAGQKSGPAATASEAPARTEAAAQPAPPAASAAASAPAPAPAPAPAITQGTVDVTVTSVPSGAMAVLIGGSQSGPTPMTFHGLAPGQTYSVKLTRSGFQTGELTFAPGAGGDPSTVKLEVKPAVLHVTSEPSGAQVWINGRRQRSLTPVDVKLSQRTAAGKRVMLSLRKAGYSNAEQQVSLDDLVDRGDTMVQEVAMVLLRRTSESPDEEADGEHGSSDASGGASSPSASGESGSESGGESGSGEKSGSSDQSNDKSPDGESTTIGRPDPIPDWMKP